MNQLSQIVRLAKPFQQTFITIIIFILILAGLNQVEPFINRSIVDAVAEQLKENSFSLPQKIIFLFILALIIRFSRRTIRRIINYLSNLFTYRFRFFLKEKGFAHLTNLSISYFDKTISGELMSKLDRGATQITSIFNNSGLYFIPSLLTAIIGIGIVSYFYWPIALWMLLMFIPFTLISLWRFKRNQKLEKKEHKLYDTQYGHFWETVTSMRLIKSFIAESFERQRLKNFQQKILSLRKTIEKNSNIAAIADLLLEAWLWITYVWVVILAFRGQFSLGTMILLINYVDIIRWPLWDLNWFFWEAKRAQIGARDYFKILNARSELTDPKKPIKLTDVRGRITFKNVSFAYQQANQHRVLSLEATPGLNNQEVLKNISLTIEPGSTAAFIGPSGSGKTTIVSLISRFYDPTKGKILIDNIDIKNVKKRDLRANIGWVTQEPYLFAETIEENLRYGNPDANQKQLERAARIAHCHQFIIDLPKGYQTKIGERGIQLSGGQKQRIALARVILKNPPILVLDEATSALDSTSEMLIQQALSKITKGRTTIIIAHRLSTAKNADTIFVLDKGKLVEQGNHQKLMKKKKGIYSSLFKIQAGKINKLKEWGMID